MEELLKQMEVQAKKDLALALKNQIEIAYDAAVKEAAGKVKEAIPGQVDDVIIDMIVPAIAPLIKQELVKVIEKLEA
jgi:hypothetical protein